MPSRPNSNTLSELQLYIDLLVTPITNIMNSSFASGVFPSSLKEGVVHPFFKKPAKDWQVFASYCPVTNIAFLSKLMERVVAIQTLNYLVKEGLLAKMQSAYGQFYSTETALLRVFNDILLSIYSRQELILVLLDLSSTFDTIDHSPLLDRLCHRYGFFTPYRPSCNLRSSNANFLPVPRCRTKTYGERAFERRTLI